MRVALQMDPIEAVDITQDTSFAMALEAQKRGADLFVYGPADLRYEAGEVLASVTPVTVRAVSGDHVSMGPQATINLATDIDVVLMRQDPPFDMQYITACHILELLKGQTLVVNDPEYVRSSPEKLFPLLFPELIPPTLITRDLTAVRAFRTAHEDIILKPLYGNGGAGVFRVKPDDSNFESLLEMFIERGREQFIAQAFLPDVAAGDKRIILVDGVLVGGFNRVPLKGETRSNMHVGGTPKAVDLTDRDIEICNKIGPELKKRGQVFVGIDVIGGYLTEVNVTSPTGVLELKKFTGLDATAKFWDAVEARLV